MLFYIGQSSIKTAMCSFSSIYDDDNFTAGPSFKNSLSLFNTWYRKINRKPTPSSRSTFKTEGVKISLQIEWNRIKPAPDTVPIALPSQTRHFANEPSISTKIVAFYLEIVGFFSSLSAVKLWK